MRNLLLIVLLFCVACKTNSNTDTPHVLITTAKGEIEIELYATKAPQTVAAFLSYIDSGLYNNASFYRVLNIENQPSNAPKTELIQGGIWRTNYKKAAALKGIPHESTQMTGLHHVDGTISMARLEPGTATSEFFICLDEQPGLDFGGENIADGQGYAAFGKVVRGMDVVRKIYRQNEDGQYFTTPISIFSMRRL